MDKIILFAKLKTCKSCNVGQSLTGASRGQRWQIFYVFAYLEIADHTSDPTNLRQRLMQLEFT